MLAAVETLDLRVYKVAGKRARAELYRSSVSLVRAAVSAKTLLTNIRGFTKTETSDDWFRYNLQQPVYENPAIKYALWEYEKHLSPNFQDGDTVLFGDLQIDHSFPTGTSVLLPGSVSAVTSSTNWRSTRPATYDSSRKS
jgi:hypothetical protein